MPKPTPELLDHHKVLDDLFALLHQDFGCPNDIADEHYNHFDPSHAAWHAMDILNSIYAELDEDDAEMIADRIIDGYKGGDPDIENVTTIH